MRHIIVRVVLNYITAVIFAFVLGNFAWYICFLPESFFGVCLVYVPTVLYLIIFLAWPIGLPVGIYFSDRLLFKIANKALWEILAGYLMSLLCIVFLNWILPVFGVDVLVWAPTVFGVNIDAYMFLFISAFFCLIGYRSGRLFKDHLRAVPQACPESLTRNLSARRGGGSRLDGFSETKWQIVGSEKYAFLTLITLMMVVFLLVIFRPTPWKAEEKAKVFLEQVVASVNDGTDFYKKHSRENAINVVEEHKDMISNSYVIEVFNNEDPFEYFITFDKKHTFKADITKSKGGLILDRFYFIPGRVGYRHEPSH